VARAWVVWGLMWNPGRPQNQGQGEYVSNFTRMSPFAPKITPTPHPRFRRGAKSLWRVLGGVIFLRMGPDRPAVVNLIRNTSRDAYNYSPASYTGPLGAVDGQKYSQA
jgi:hypothetical protein